MGVDIVYFSRHYPGLLHGDLHGHACTAPIRGRRCNVISIVGHAVADDLTEDPGSSSDGMLVFFQYQNACAFTQHESVPVLIEGSRRPIRITACGECF